MNNSNNLKTEIAEKLSGLSNNLTVSDKLEASEKLQIHTATVRNYLMGHVKNLDTAINLLDFFQQKIETRIKEFQRITAA